MKKIIIKKIILQSFAGNATNMTLLQIFEKNNSYNLYINQDMINFKYCLEIVKEIKTDEIMLLILNKKFLFIIWRISEL